MPKCDVCGNDYDNMLQITQDGRMGTFDSFECAIHAMAPTCAHCGCKVIGHGHEERGQIFCCRQCSQHAAHAGDALQDERMSDPAR
jgi:Rieske Fe-S protein